MSKLILTVQDISCFGQCSITVAQPILSHRGIETAILPSAILSTHTAGFKNFTVLDLTEEMPKIIKHWEESNIKFDAIYTGYIGDVRQFDYILEIKDKLLKNDGLFIVDPAMADHGKLYPALNEDIVLGMKKICSVADYILPNITEACFLTNVEYKDTQDEEFITLLNEKLIKLGCKNVILTGVFKDSKIGATAYDGVNKVGYFTEYQTKSYHGTGDIFSSVIVADILNNKPIIFALEDACEFVVKCIKKTVSDDTHNYGVKFEEVMSEE